MRDFKLLSRMVVATGTVVFLFSVVLPFLECVYAPLVQIPERSVSKVELWSFKCSVETFGFRHSKFELWFFDYWLQFSDVSMVYAVVFSIQTLTLSASIAFLFIKKGLLALMPTIICPVSTILMICTFTYLSHAPGCGWVNYHAGYWLTYLAETLFIIGVLLKRKFD